jgi:serine/threonine protein kinase
MDLNRNQRVAALFESAMDLSTSAQKALLDRECNGDLNLRRQVERLLKIDRNAAPLEVLPPEDAAALQATQELCGTRPRPGKPPSDNSPVPGNSLGQYELIRELGRGGMGKVYLARDLRLGRLAAIKVLARSDAKLTERFLTEARATARCRHENIVVIYEVGKQGSYPYMALEYLQGQTLREWLDGRRYQIPGAGMPSAFPPLASMAAVELIVPVVRALVCAHEMGIVHRDLKPENIMLTDSGTIKVLDFGIAKLLATPPTLAWIASDKIGEQTALTATGTCMGTLPYMSPEQLNAEKNIDHRCDVWAVGIMLYEMVTGQHPLAPLSRERLMQVGDLDIPMPSVREHTQEAGRLGGIIDRCLLKPKHDRTQTVQELLSELESFLPRRRMRVVGSRGNPFAGLAAFQEEDAERFFGRNQEIVSIVAQLRIQPMVTIVGLSGTGKSSLVRAGVIPALKRSGEGWDACVVRPGREPMVALAGLLEQAYGSSVGIESSSTGSLSSTALDHASSSGLGPVIKRLRAEPGFLGARLRSRAASKLRRILVFVDQFEELYTLGAPQEERATFLACLAAVADDAASPLRVILSMRSDFLDRLAEERYISVEITRGLVFLPPMSREGMREALLRPVEANEYRFESPALVSHMVDILAFTPGALPLLQFTAARLWERRDTDRRLLTEASYEQLGGVAGALATHADAVLAGMPSEEQTMARTVLERLVTPERTRALVSMAELCSLDGSVDMVEHVVQHLAAMRLLVIERDEGADRTVELVHESLIDRWPTLARWLAENQEDVAFLARLRSAALEWEKRDRDEGLLWRGAPAQEAKLWHAHYRGALARREQDYLDAVFALVDRAVRVRRRIVGGSMALMALLLVGASVALIQIRQAQREAGRQAEIARAQADERAQAQQEAARQAQAASARALEAEQAQQKAEQAQQKAEQAQREAEQARVVAEAERTRTVRETVKTRAALVQAQRSEARALEAEAEAHQSLESAKAAAEAERRMRQELQDFIDRALGHVTDLMPVPAP